jgi:hypothetical protein
VKKRLIVLLSSFFITAFFGFSASAQEKQGPRMILEEERFDSGEVKEGEVISHSFKVLNQGDQPLEIKNVKPG